MNEIERAFANFALTGLAVQPDGSWQWGTWRIEQTLMCWMAIDDAGPIDANSPWPLRMQIAADAYELAAWLADEGPGALDASAYAALQARADALIAARKAEVV
jgi:hypothetical protein